MSESTDFKYSTLIYLDEKESRNGTKFGFEKNLKKKCQLQTILTKNWTDEKNWI